MSHTSNDDGAGMITGINVTPLVDVVLVLLVVLMVTAGYIVAQTLPMDLPEAQTGQSANTLLAISVDSKGKLYLDAEPLDWKDLGKKVRAAKEKGAARALIAADGDTRHRAVVRVMDILRQEGISRFAINVRPKDAHVP